MGILHIGDRVRLPHRNIGNLGTNLCDSAGMERRVLVRGGGGGGDGGRGGLTWVHIAFWADYNRVCKSLTFASGPWWCD